MFENLLENTYMLVRSLTIKIDEIRKHFDFHFFIKYGKTPPNKIESKYYLNLIGKKFVSDPDVTVLLNNTNYILDKELLNNMTNFKLELLKYGETYLNVIKDNKPMTTYIKGILNDFTMDEIINISNHKILSYREDLIAENEYNLINDIQDFIDIFFTRYFRPEYIMDELYLPASLNMLYNNLIIFILVKRIENINSGEINIELLKLWLDTYKKSSKYTEIFDLETFIRLKNDLNNLKKFLGRNSTHNKLVNDYINKTIFYLENIQHSSKAPEIDDKLALNIKEEYISYNEIFPIINTLTVNPYSGYLTRNNLLELENKYIDINKNIYEKIKLRKLTKAETLNLNITNYPMYYEIEQFFLNNVISILLYKAEQNDETINVFINGMYFNLKYSEFVNIILLAILNTLNLDEAKFNIQHIYNRNVNTYELIKNSRYGEAIISFKDNLLDTINYDNIIEDLNFNTMYNRFLDYSKNLLLYVVNITDNMLKEDILLLDRFLFKDIAVSVNKKDILSKLSNSLRDLLENARLDTITTIFKDSFNVDLDKDKLINDYIEIIEDFYNNFTSYTVQLLSNVKYTSSIIYTPMKNDLNSDYLPNIVSIKTLTELYRTTPITIFDYSFSKNFITITNNKPLYIEDTAFNTMQNLYCLNNEITTGLIICSENSCYIQPYNPIVNSYNAENTIDYEPSSLTITTETENGTIDGYEIDVAGIDITSGEIYLEEE